MYKFIIPTTLARNKIANSLYVSQTQGSLHGAFVAISGELLIIKHISMRMPFVGCIRLIRLKVAAGDFEKYWGATAW